MRGGLALLLMLSAGVARADAGVSLSTADRWREEFSIHNVEFMNRMEHIRALLREIHEIGGQIP